MKTSPTLPPSSPDAPGFGRDIELEADRHTDRPATAELDSTQEKADEEPILGPAPDPDIYPAPGTRP